MKIQFNTNNSIEGGERQSEFFSGLISEKLARFNSDVTRMEVHLTDENGDKKGPTDKRWVLEARLEGKKPIAVTNESDSVEKAINGAIDKMKKSLDKALLRN
jgi:ribosome-associated translation inhibitor RaiA